MRAVGLAARNTPTGFGCGAARTRQRPVMGDRCASLYEVVVKPRTYISQLVLDEAAAGDSDAAALRLAALQEVVILDTSEEAIALGYRLLAVGGLPAKAAADALHVAVAAVHGLDYLVTWNCTHIANARMRGKIEGICRSAGYDPPMLCTPFELMEE